MFKNPLQHLSTASLQFPPPHPPSPVRDPVCVFRQGAGDAVRRTEAQRQRVARRQGGAEGQEPPAVSGQRHSGR